MSETTPRRGFLGRLIAAAAALGLPLAEGRAAGAGQQAGPDDWMNEVKGTNRCLFDFPRHSNGFGLAHVFNYLATYTAAYKTGVGQVGAVGTFYGMGPGSSIAMGFNDAVWAKYGLGEYHGLKDETGKPYTRNPFSKSTKADSHLLAAAIQSPNIGLLGDLMAGLSIEGLQKVGTKFIMCNNALEGWCLELEARGKGTAADIGKDLRANLLPGVTIVPAMVIAIERAQAAGIRYNRQ